MATVDRIRWIENRIKHLESVRDDASQPQEQRTAAETELETWRQDSGYRWRWLRRSGVPWLRNRGVTQPEEESKDDDGG